MRRTICDKRPEQLKMAFALWTRAAVMQFIEREFGVRLSIRATGEYLRRWGFTLQKPIKRAYEQRPEAVQQWLDKTYPAIAQQAKAEGGEIHWGDETALVNTDVRSRSYAPGLRAVQRLDLALLIAAQHQRMLGRRHVQADDVFELFDKLTMSSSFSTNFGSRETLNVSTRCGLRPWACQIRSTLLSLTPICSARRRVLQCVAAAGVVCVVRRTISAASMRGLRPLRGKSASIAARPPLANRSRQRPT